MFKISNRHRIAAAVTATVLFMGIAIGALPEREAYATYSTDAVSVKVHKNAPSGKNPAGAVYTAYKDSACTSPVGTFTIKSNGDSETKPFTAAGINSNYLYIKETKTPTASTGGDFTWLPDTKVYSVNLNSSSSNFNVSGATPATKGTDWILLDRSASFTVDRDMTATIWLVGGGTDGADSTTSPVMSAADAQLAHDIVFDSSNHQVSVENPVEYEKLRLYSYNSGKGGDGGYVYSATGVQLTEGQSISATVAGVNNRTGTSMTVGGTTYRCNQSGSTSKTGGAGGTLPANNTAIGTLNVPYFVSWQQRATAPGNGANGVNTPYGYVGSSAGGGSASAHHVTPDWATSPLIMGGTSGVGAGAGAHTGALTTDVGEPATNYGCGGGGGSVNFPYYGKGGKAKGGCIIIQCTGTASSQTVNTDMSGLRTTYNYVQVNKSIGSVPESGKTYSLAGAVYGVYGDQACANKLGEVTTAANGASDKLKVSWGANATGRTVYVKELSAPTGGSGYSWDLDTTVYPVSLSCTGYIANDASVPVRTASSIDNVQEYVDCYIKKVTSYQQCYAEMAEGNSCYSLAGAEFVIETAYPTRRVVGTYRTNAEGITPNVKLAPGTYYITETKAPKGYMLPENPTQQVNIIQGSEASCIATFEDIPVTDPVQIWIDKDWAS